MMMGPRFPSWVGVVLIALPILARADGFRPAAPTAQETQHRREIAAAYWNRQTLALVSPAQFLQLSTSQQKLVLATYREVVFELEAIEPKDSARAGLPDETASLSDLIALFDGAIDDASAQDSGGAAPDNTDYACFFGGWPSVLHGTKCAQPTKDNDPLYAKLAGESNCPSGSFTCFPGIFGKGACFTTKPEGEGGHHFPLGTMAGCSAHAKNPDVADMQAALTATNKVMTKACGGTPPKSTYICNSMGQKLKQLQTAIKDVPAAPDKSGAKPVVAPKPSSPAQKQLACFQAIELMHTGEMQDNIAPAPGSTIKPGECGKVVKKSSTTTLATAAATPAPDAVPFEWCWGVPPKLITIPAQMNVTEPDLANPSATTTKLYYGTLVRTEGSDYFFPVSTNQPTPPDGQDLEFFDRNLDDINKNLENAKKHKMDKDAASGLIDSYIATDLASSASTGSPCANPTGDALTTCKNMLTTCQSDGDAKTVEAAGKILAQPPYTPAAAAPVVPVEPEKPAGDPPLSEEGGP